MASFWYDNAKLILGKADLDFDTAALLNARLLMSNTTAGTQKSVTTVAGFTTLDNYDGSGVTSPVALASGSIAVDNANNRAEVTAANFSFGTTVGAGTRNAIAMLICKVVGGTTDIPIAYIDTGGFPFNGNGGAINVTIDAEGLLQIT
jgi:hypothetical protein